MGKKSSRNIRRTAGRDTPTPTTVIRSIIIYNQYIKKWVELDPKLDLELIDHWNL